MKPGNQRLVARWADRWPIILGLLATALLLVWLSPYAVSAYHLEVGGRALDQATRSGSTPDLTALAKARTHLEAALRWKRDNVQAYQLLSRVALLEKQPLRAAEALKYSTDLIPGNPLSWWELAQIYQTMSQQVADSPALNLMDLFQAKGGGSSETQRDSGIASDEGTEMSSGRAKYVEWKVPIAPGSQPEGLGILKGTLHQQVLALRPPSRVELRVAMPITATTLIFWIGMEPSAWPFIQDGTSFQVMVDDTEVFSHYLNIEEARQGWWPGQADLTSWAGQEVKLILQAHPGSAREEEDAWVGWGNVKLVGPDSAIYSLLAPAERAAAAWHTGGYTAEDFLHAGEKDLNAGRYEEALSSYERVAMMEPESGDLLYYKGAAYAGLRQLGKALDLYSLALQKISAEQHQMGAGDVYCAMGWLFHWLADPRDPARALQYYDLAVEQSFSNQEAKADCYLKRADLLLWEYGTPDKAAKGYEAVLQLQPDNVYALASLAMAHYRQFHSLEDAVSEFQSIIQKYPQNKWGYWRLGDIYAMEGQYSDAVQMYQMALSLEPTNEQLRSMVADLTQKSEKSE
jgi:tetratricopeptide (TPR) repeat protein